MSVITLPRVPKGVSVEQLAEIVAGLSENLEFLLTGNLSTVNAREFAGWRINQQAIQSKDGKVGMSTVETADDNIRFWAGDILTGIPVWYVTKGGLMVAANADIKGKITAESGKIGGFTIELDKLVGAGIIEGGIIRTGPPGTKRIEITNNSIKTLNSADQLQGFGWGADTSGVDFFGDAYLYHGGVKYVEFYDTGTSYTIRATPESTGLGIGGTATTYPKGPWDFTGATVTGVWADNTTSQRSSFSAFRSGTNQPIPAGLYTKLQCNTERFDNKNEYDSVTNYEHTCSVSGNYSVSAGVRFLSQPAGNTSIVAVYVNGVERTRLWQNSNGAAGLVVASGSDEIDLIVGDKTTIMVYTAAADSVEAGAMFSRFKMTKIA